MPRIVLVRAVVENFLTKFVPIFCAIATFVAAADGIIPAVKPMLTTTEPAQNSLASALKTTAPPPATKHFLASTPRRTAPTKHSRTTTPRRTEPAQNSLASALRTTAPAPNSLASALMTTAPPPATKHFLTSKPKTTAPTKHSRTATPRRTAPTKHFLASTPRTTAPTKHSRTATPRTTAPTKHFLASTPRRTAPAQNSLASALRTTAPPPATKHFLASTQRTTTPTKHFLASTPRKTALPPLTSVPRTTARSQTQHSLTSTPIMTASASTQHVLASAPVTTARAQNFRALSTSSAANMTARTPKQHYTTLAPATTAMALHSPPPSSSSLSCNFLGQSMPSGQYMTHRAQFNVTCLNGRIRVLTTDQSVCPKVLNCVTARGVQLPLGTKAFVEDGVRYSCQLNMLDSRKQRAKLLLQQQNTSVEHAVPECDQQLNGGGRDNSRGEFVRDGFVVDCATNRILGCLDMNGDLVKSDHFYTLSAWQLRRCEVYGRGRWAKSERKAIFGCFNGTALDDPDDAKMHLPVGRIWPSGPFELRCGDDGLQVYKCIVNGRRIHTGTAWIDGDNVLNVCK